MSARDEVLGRVRLALADVGPGAAAPHPEGYRTRGDLDPVARLDRLAERLADYRALVRRAEPGQVLDVISAALAERGARRLVVPPGLDLPGAVAGAELVQDDGLSAAELDAFDGVITRAAVAVAETGTIVLDGSAGQGRRALSLIPDYHLCLIEAGQVVGLVPEAVARLDPGRPLTWISGPSATSDIELNRVEGVHGPRTLDVILIGP
ncbi:MAG: lactate utilization protein C [Streptosporangiales bacterium]